MTEASRQLPSCHQRNANQCTKNEQRRVRNCVLRAGVIHILSSLSVGTAGVLSLFLRSGSVMDYSARLDENVVKAKTVVCESHRH